MSGVRQKMLGIQPRRSSRARTSSLVFELIGISVLMGLLSTCGGCGPSKAVAHGSEASSSSNVEWKKSSRQAIPPMRQTNLIGELSPDFSGLMSVAPQFEASSFPSRFGLKSLSEPVIVLAFLSSSCPVSAAYEARLIQFAQEWKPQGVRLIAIAVNPFACDQPEALLQRAKERGVPFVWTRDTGQELVKKFGVETTPSFFVLDRERRIRYAGAFDDDFKTPKVSRHYLEDAVRSLLIDQPIAVTQTKSRGSVIVFQDGPRPNR